jgi:hypothetical protein
MCGIGFIGECGRLRNQWRRERTREASGRRGEGWQGIDKRNILAEAKFKASRGASKGRIDAGCRPEKGKNGCSRRYSGLATAVLAISTFGPLFGARPWMCIADVQIRAQCRLTSVFRLISRRRACVGSEAKQRWDKGEERRDVHDREPRLLDGRVWRSRRIVWSWGGDLCGGGECVCVCGLCRNTEAGQLKMRQSSVNKRTRDDGAAEIGCTPRKKLRSVCR